MSRWPSWVTLTFDLIKSGRAAAGLPRVPASLTYDAGTDPLPRYRVSTLPSTHDRLEALPIVEIETLATTFAEAERLATDIDDILMGYPLSTSSGGRVVLVDRVDVISSPAEISLEGESKIRRFLATYQLTVRRV